MASTRSKAWGPTHPSAAFLIKCAKEKEKLRSTLQIQLQDHMLCMYQNKLFSDTLIGVNATKPSCNENKAENPNQHPDLPQLFHAHKSILKVRTPAFYDHLLEHQQSNLNVQSYNSFLGESELQELLRKIYTDDDIRKYECEALRLSKKYKELLCQNKAPVNKHIVEVDEFEKESVNSTCTDNFVTPKTSPVSPEAKLDVSDLFKNAQKKNYNGNCIIDGNSNTVNMMKGLHPISNLPEEHREINNKLTTISFKSNGNETLEEYSTCDDKTKNDTCEKETFSSYADAIGSDQETEADFSNIGSMVRSNTFDLETQGSLDDAADDNLDWCSRISQEDDFKEEEGGRERLKDVLSSRRTDGTGFFLHDHTPSPKSNIFKHGFLKDSSYINNHNYESDSSTSGLHFRRFDGSMSDSGFMSHSTFSVISDTGFPNSVSSSLIMSTDGISNSPITNMSNGTETTLSKLDKSKCLSGSMFPFYIDINNLPPASPTHKKEKKSSPSHTYMYIDASSPKRSRNALRRPPYLNSSYEEFFSEFESDYEYPKQMPLMKAQSTSQLDMYRGDFRANRGSDKHKKFRPQSCYMYVDLDSLKVDQTGKYSKGILGKQEPMSVSMFINLNEEHNQPNEDDSDINHKDINVNSVLDSKSESQLKPQMKEYWALSDKVNGEHKRKLSDSSLADSMHHYEHNVNFQSLSKHNESRSASALDYQYVNTQENSLSHKRNIIPRKSHSAQRYSDGIYYDNLYQKKYAPDLCNSYENKIWNTAKNSYGKDLKHISQTIKVMQGYDKNEEPSGSCSDLGKISTCDKLFSSDKVKWKSTGDMGKTKSNKSDEEGGLLPMSPILRRKSQTKEIPKSAPPPVVVKASTKPQDIDAMTFPKSLKDVDEAQKISNKSTMDDTKPDLILCQSPSRKKLDRIDDSKSSSESSRLGSEGLFELCDLKDKNIDAMSRSGSSLMTISGGDSSSDKHVSHDPVKEKFTHSPLTLSVSCDFEDDSETVYSEVSDVSSSIGGISGVASLERRWREAQNLQIDPNSKNSRTARQMLEACSKLGEDLLKMFLDEIDTDITIEVEEKQIKAHRCILASRCKYFANLLRNTSTDKNSSTISLEGFSYPAVHFALCHIYSGAMNIPKDCNISELALLADMLHLDTLTDIIVFHLKMHFCHFFHRPCLQCTQGVVECLPLAAVCGLNDLRDKCIHWLGKHFTRTWPNKSFASLSEELRDLCYNVTVQLLAVDSVIDMTLNCDRLMTTLPQLKWTEPIFGMVTKLLQDCIHFMAQNFNQILNSEGFLALGKGQSWNVTALEEDIISSIELMTPDVACKSYVTVNQLLSLIESEENSEYAEFTQNFVDLLHKISRHCERYLIQNANKVVHCQSWACLSPQVQKRIKDAAVIVFEFEKPTAPPPRLSSLQRKLKKQNDSEDMSCLERSTYPKKGRSVQVRKSQRDLTFSTKNNNSPLNQDSIDRNSQWREADSLIKKAVSPIKEEANNVSADQSAHDISHDLLPVALNPYNSSIKSHFCNKLYIDAHEEDSLRDLQDLPQDQTHSPSHGDHGSESQLICSVASLDMDDSRSPAHCSDNPDSLEANEEISSDSKDDLDASVSVEDISNQEKGLNEAPEVIGKNFEITDMKKEEKEPKIVKSNISSASSLPKPTLSVPVRDKVPILHPLIQHTNETNAQNKISCDKSPTRKAHGKSLVPLAKLHTSEDKKSPISPDTRSKDLVAEIDADSRMVNHCLQEAEMLEQQLSRKLQRQHQDGSSNISHYIQKSSSKTHLVSENIKSSKNTGSRLQKASSTSQIKNLVGSPRGRSPGRAVKSNASSPSVGQPPRILRCNDSAKERVPSRKSSQSPKGSTTPMPRSLRSMESIAKQLPISSPNVSKRVSPRSNRSKAITVNNVRTPIIGPK